MIDTPLGEKIRFLIETNGPMSVADYMALCLGDPAHGYYATRDPFGVRGDFVTAPEVSQMFGEIVGAWLVHAWRMAGAPAPVKLVELGPGRGTLMADILRVTARAEELRDALSVHLVESSPVLTALQAKTLEGARSAVTWHGSFAEIPPGALLLVANEFFDALPVRQFVRVGGIWRERVVGLDRERKLAFGVGTGTMEDGEAAAITSPLWGGRRRQAERGRFREGGTARTPKPPSRTSPSAPRPAKFDLPSRGRLSEGSILEVRPAAEAIVGEIARRIVENGGAALIADYGHGETATGETLQAVRGHAYTDPLDAPGETDLTAHVDFAALSRAASAEGAAVHGPMPQGEFLMALGLAERAERLGANDGAATRKNLRAAVERLVGTDQMGSLFKVLALTRPGVSPPPFPPIA